MATLPGGNTPLVQEGSSFITPAWLRIIQQIIPTGAAVVWPSGTPIPPAWQLSAIASPPAGHVWITRL